MRVLADMAKFGDCGGLSGWHMTALDSMPKLILLIFDDLCCMLHTCLVKSTVCKADSCRIKFDREGTQSSSADLFVTGTYPNCSLITG